jgi:hypothetical protein
MLFGDAPRRAVSLRLDASLDQASTLPPMSRRDGTHHLRVGRAILPLRILVKHETGLASSFIIPEKLENSL